MENFKIAALALGLLVLSGCATYDRVAARDYGVTENARVASVTPADATPGAGGPGGAGAGVAR